MRKILYITMLFTVAHIAIAQDDATELSSGTLSLPFVKVGKNFFNVKLNAVGNAEAMEFVLGEFFKVTPPTAEGYPFFQKNTLFIPTLTVDGELMSAELALVDIQALRFRVTAFGPHQDSPPAELVPPASCTIDRDPSHGPDNPAITSGWAVPTQFVRDGGPAPDGIPPLETPFFQSDPLVTQTLSELVLPDQLVVGVKIGNDIRAYPHNILDWHEVVNDEFQVNGVIESVTLSYCPLTGSAVLWDAFAQSANPTFGTSGLLYNSNLIMYDRETGSLWSQMLEQSINGNQILNVPDRMQVVETTWETWSTMYPNTKVLSRNTGFSRNYDQYPYGSFRSDSSLFFSVNNANDGRLHRKERVVGVNVGNSSKVYPISRLGASGVEVINDTVGGEPLVIAGSAGNNFGVIYHSLLDDCTVLDFEPVQDSLPVVMKDHEGNEWDIFGQAVSGPRTGQKLTKTNSYISYWFAWTAFFPGADIHE